MSSYVKLVGLRVQLRRTKDRPCGVCGETAVVIGLGAGPHAHSLHCAGCTRHRGWLPQQIADFLIETITHFGMPPTIITIRNAAGTGAPATTSRTHHMDMKGPRV